MAELYDFFSRLPKIEVLPGVLKKNFTSKKTGETGSFQYQNGYLTKADSNGRIITSAVQIGVPREGVPCAPGLYVIDGESFSAGNFGDLMLNRYDLKLLPIPQSVASIIEQDSKR